MWATCCQIDKQYLQSTKHIILHFYSTLGLAVYMVSDICPFLDTSLAQLIHVYMLYLRILTFCALEMTISKQYLYILQPVALNREI